MVNTFFQLLRNRKVGPSTENLDINCFPPHGLDKRRIVVHLQEVVHIIRQHVDELARQLRDMLVQMAIHIVGAIPVQWLQPVPIGQARF